MRFGTDARAWWRVLNRQWTYVACSTLLLAATSGSGIAKAQAPAGANGEDVVYMRQPFFKIPVQMQNKSTKINELRLFVSSDRGRTWQLMKTARPTQTSFTFRAQTDGEYWFTLAFVDETGQAEPADVSKAPPGLKVVVDTLSPTLELAPTSAADYGKAGVSWKLSDDGLDVSSLKIEVCNMGEADWRELSVAKSTEGEADWRASADESFLVRASVLDRAGNVGIAKIEIPAARQKAAGLTKTNATSEAGEADEQPNNFAMPSPPARPMPGSMAQSPPRSIDLDSAAADSVTPPRPAIPATGEAIPRAGQYGRRQEAAPQSHMVDYGDRPEGNQFLRSAAPTGYPATAAAQQAMPFRRAPQPPVEPVVFDRSRPALPAQQREPSRDLERTVVRADYERAPVDRIPVASTSSEIVRTSAVESKPEQARPRQTPIVNSKSFEINYGLKGLGPAGAGKVELYFTMDNGASWKLYGEDEDHTPPFQITVEKEGRYGFKLLVSNAAGFGPRPPQPGEAPQTVLEVDTTPPEAELYQPIPDPKAKSNVLLISWSARDQHLKASPVNLYFAEFAEGPWYAIQGELPATGEYAWHVPQNVPFKVFLRLVAADAAENVSVADTPEPILIDFSQPEAEVIGIAKVPGDTETK